MVAITVTAPAECRGVVQVTEVDDNRTKLVQRVPSNLTVTPLKNPVPVTVTEVPPASAPLEAATEVTVGAA